MLSVIRTNRDSLRLGRIKTTGELLSSRGELINKSRQIKVRLVIRVNQTGII